MLKFLQDALRSGCYAEGPGLGRGGEVLTFLQDALRSACYAEGFGLGWV